MVLLNLGGLQVTPCKLTPPHKKTPEKIKMKGIRMSSH